MSGTVRQRVAMVVTLLTVVAIVPAVGTGSVIATGETAAYVPVGPIRLADTRETPCGCTRLDASTIRVSIAGRTGIPADIVAAAITVTATPTKSHGFVTAYPSRTDKPNVSTLNTRPDRVVANSAIVAVGDDGAIEFFHLVSGDVIIDVTGVFTAADIARAGRFMTIPTARLVDTREAAHGARPLGRNGDLTVPLPAGVSADATAVVVNVTSVLEPSAGHLSARPAGAAPRTTSFMNPNGSGLATAASIIVPVSPTGLTIRSFAGGHVIVDNTGWFTGPSAPESDAGLFRPHGPTRLLDTRDTPPRINARGAVELPVSIADAGALITNVTVTRADRQGFVTAFPAGTALPSTSTVNPIEWDHTVANLAITQVSTRGLAYWSLAGTDLVVDVTGVFTGSPTPATRAPLPNTPVRSRAILIGDSTLAGLHIVTDALVALRGFDSVVDAKSCRRLMRPSCHSDITNITPDTAVEAILSAPGTFDYVVVKAGYNDWFSDFPAEFGAVVGAARAKGAHTVIWFTQNEAVGRTRAQQAYIENNVDLRWLTALPQYTDVVLANWQGYADPRPDWFHDGTHVTHAGAYAITDYVARWIAALEHRPCPRPWVVGGPVADPCPSPDVVGPVPDPVAVGQ
jgi:hypothetical protein